MLKRAITAFLSKASVSNKDVSKDIEFVSRAYELILQRPLDKAGKAFERDTYDNAYMTIFKEGLKLDYHLSNKDRLQLKFND